MPPMSLSTSFTYIIVTGGTYFQYRSFLVPDDMISSEDRLALEELQVFGSLDAPMHARQTREQRVRQMCINLYMFEYQKGNGKNTDEDYINGCKYRYEKLHQTSFDGLFKWKPYKRISNTQTTFNNISHIYELVDNTFEE